MKRAARPLAMTSESDLKASCLKALGRLGVFAMGNALRGRVAKAGLGPGSPDIVVVLQPIGVFVAIELKKATKQRDAQAKWQARFEREGGQYFICRTMQEVVDAIATARAKIQAMTRVVARVPESCPRIQEDAVEGDF